MKKIKYLLGAIMIVGGLGVATIKDIDNTDTGIMITFNDSTGYYLEK